MIDKTKLDELHNIREAGNKIDFNNYLNDFLTKYVKKNHNIEDYIGDYPSFIEPVYLGQNVEIGDDVLLGPNVFIGDNCKIGDYNEISNSILLDNVKLGNLIILNNCIIINNSQLKFENLSVDNCILMGTAESKEELKIKRFED
ncbi:MAG: hypothetical protein KGD57_03270 [Candidatus Lokiarchaeota archaeon]|nr:hypothetical protein [Candidatus Lokiarchaeota archaeon]